jgi:phosphoribosyl-ATP pyrophosphohydrolase
MQFLFRLEKLIWERQQNPPEKSYTAELFAGGMSQITKKVGEETTELIIAALTENRQDLENEAADLLYHFLVLLCAKKVTLADIQSVLQKRHLKC